MVETVYLLDTNIISELARKSPDAAVVNFISTVPKILVSSIMFHELSYGLEIASTDQKTRLTKFIVAMRDRFGPNAIPIDVHLAETAGQLRAFEKKQGRVLTVIDALIAATAMTKGAVLVTRNVKDFEMLSIPLINPFLSIQS